MGARPVTLTASKANEACESLDFLAYLFKEVADRAPASRGMLW